jgi:hypothetical protein
MSRHRLVRPVLALCCALALLLVVVAPVLAQGAQAPSPKTGTTPGMQQNPGTSGSTTQGTTGTYHKKHATKKSHQGTANAGQKPGSSTGINPGTRSKQGTTTNEQKGGVSGLKNGSNTDTNSGNPPR